MKSLNVKLSQVEMQLAEKDAMLEENAQKLKYQSDLHVQKIEELTELLHKSEALKKELLKEEERLELKCDNLQATMEKKEEEVKRIESKMVSIEKERSDLSFTVSSLTSSLNTVTSEMNAKLSSLQDQGQVSMAAYEAENNSLRSTNATLTAELASCKREATEAREEVNKALKEAETIRAELTSARSKEKQLLLQIQVENCLFSLFKILCFQEIQDECTTLKGVDKKRLSLQSHMISLQEELGTYKSMLAEKQQKNEQLQNKLAKVQFV